MSSSAVALPRMGFKFMLVVRSGPDAGASFQLLPPRVTIGRGGDCDVALADLRMSRNAAVIDLTMEKIVISDVSSRQSLVVNGQFVSSASIKDGDVIQIGESELVFSVEAMQLHPPGSSLGHPPGQHLRSISGAHADPFAGAPDPMTGVYSGPTPGMGGLSSRQKFYGVIGAVLLLFGWAMMSNDKIKAASHIKTVEELSEEIKASELTAEVTKRIFRNDEERTRFEEANRHFAEGFRDYQQGNWSRAMRSFETARTIDPQHQLAERYYKLAEKKRDELIADLTLNGRRYREKNMFVYCSASFEKVLELITNKDDAKYKVALAMKKECDIRVDQRFKYN